MTLPTSRVNRSIVAPGADAPRAVPVFVSRAAGFSPPDLTGLENDSDAEEPAHENEKCSNERSATTPEAAGALILAIEGTTVALQPIVHRFAIRTREAVHKQRAAAREALHRCAKTCSAPLTGWTQRSDGAPLAQHGWHWSISHKRRWACAALSRQAVGIDIEEVAPRRVPLYEEIGREQEWAMLGGRSWPAFFRLWTTKEATLKANGVGIGAMPHCRLTHTIDDAHLVATYKSASWQVAHVAFDDHIVAVATPS